MVLRRAMHLSLALLVTAGSGVFASVSVAQTTATKPKTTPSQTASSKSTGKSGHRSTKKVSSRKKDKGQMAPTPERISEIQEALAKDGSYANSPTGKWDDSTVDAMKKFQSAHGLNPSGKLDALTLQKLGLGSQTAGIAEPIAPPNSTSRLSGNALQTSRQ
jgi:peptidoglycan hydrolase-like protein with peptidoglycan-binding domain